MGWKNERESGGNEKVEDKVDSDHQPVEMIREDREKMKRNKGIDRF